MNLNPEAILKEKILKNDFETKLKSSNLKVYFFGTDEKLKIFEPINLSKFSDDRVHVIEKELRIQMKNNQIYLIKIPSEEKNMGIIIACLLKDRKPLGV